MPHVTIENGKVKNIYRFKQECTIEIAEDSQEWQDYLAKQEQEKNNQQNRVFLNETDWQVIRHRDQVNLEITTSLQESEYLALLNNRQQARESILT